MDELTNKTMYVILSCKTFDQLRVAIKFTELAYRKLSREGLATMKHITLLERSIGYAQCQIKLCGENRDEVR